MLAGSEGCRGWVTSHVHEKKGGRRTQSWETLEFRGCRRKGPDWTWQNVPAALQASVWNL